jgi:hypothetical protein
MKASRGILLVALALLAVAALRDIARLGQALPWRGMDDFADFYCAGDVLRSGITPYTYEPLRSCEHRINVGDSFRAQLFERNPNVVIPAPQPPFDFLPFMALANLPYGEAKAIGAVAIVLAVALCVVGLAALSLPWEVCASALLLSTAFVELNSGQIVPAALLALVLAGLSLARKRDALAGIFAALTAIEPTVAVPVIAAMLLFVPRARVVVIVSVVILGAISVALLGPAGALAYLTRVLPAHAASEPYFPYQYSLTYAATYFGLSPGAGRVVGDIAYALLAIFGLILASRISELLQRRELLVFIPALCAVTGGAFVHQEELAFAIPALLVLAVVARGRSRVAAAFALCALSIPWILVWGEKQLFLASLFVCAVILIRLRIDPRATLGFLGALALLIYGFELHPPQLAAPSPNSLPSYAPGDLAQWAWRDYTAARSTRDPLWFAIKLPTWIGLLAALTIATNYFLRSRHASESSPENWRETQRRSPA